MIRLLIVDDEPIERRALQKMIEDAFEEVEIVGQAGNGREAIEAAARLQPDLVTMDIKMPGIDGLQAIEAIKAANSTIKFIMVTAYDTFEFARQALKLGVSDYLLKPSKKAAIQETVGKAIDEIKAQRLEADRRLKDRERLQRLLPIVEADLVTQLLYDHMPSKHLDAMMELIGLPASRSGFVLHLHLSEPIGAEAGKEEAGEQLSELYGRIAAQLEDVSCWLGRLSGKQLAMIVYLNGDQSYRSCAIGIGRRLIQLAERHSGFEPFVGIGGLCGEARHMRRSYHEALLASADVTLPSRYCFYEDIPHRALPSIGLLTAGIEKHVLEEVRLGRWDSAADQIWQLIDVYDGAGEQVGMAQQHTFEMLVIVTRMLQEMGVEVRKKPYYSQLAASYKQLKADSRGLIEQLAESTAMRIGESAESDVVLSLKHYIREHAHEDLSLERVAAVVDRNPFYVSKLFKEHFGMNYIDYLTECRMENAKQLMQETDKSLKEITYEVGYNDPNYFSRVFKKIIGHSPTEYRKMLLRPSNLKRG